MPVEVVGVDHLEKKGDRQSLIDGALWCEEQEPSLIRVTTEDGHSPVADIGRFSYQFSSAPYMAHSTSISFFISSPLLSFLTCRCSIMPFLCKKVLPQKGQSKGPAFTSLGLRTRPGPWTRSVWLRRASSSWGESGRMKSVQEALLYTDWLSLVSQAGTTRQTCRMTRLSLAHYTN